MIRSGCPEKRGFGRPRLRGPFGTLVGGSVWGPRRDEQFMMFYKSFRCATVAKTKKKWRGSRNAWRTFVERCSNVRRTFVECLDKFVERSSNVVRTFVERLVKFDERSSNVVRTFIERCSSLRRTFANVHSRSSYRRTNFWQTPAWVLVYIYIYVYICVCVHMYIYTYHSWWPRLVF